MRSWLAQRRLAILVIVGCAISLPALGVGFVLDDLLHRAVLDGRITDYPFAWFNLYEFTSSSDGNSRLISSGALPWFSHSELALRFFRPLSSFLLVLDHRLFGKSALLAHVHSLVWFALLAGSFAALMRRWFREPAATLAALIFVLAGLHATPISWLAGRHSLVAAALGVVALTALCRYREQSHRPSLWVALTLASLSLLASETGLAALVFLALYELGSRGAWRQRLGRVVPWLVLGAAYLVLYVQLGYGPRRSGAYISPFERPLGFAEAVVSKVPVLLAELFGAAPAVLATVEERAVTPLRLWGLGAFGLCIAVLVLFRGQLRPGERRLLCWLGAASVLSLIPLVGGIVDGRLLPMAMVGAAALLGNAIALLWSTFRSEERRRRWLALAVFVGLLALHLGASPMLRVLSALRYRELAGIHEQVARRAEPGNCSQHGRLYLLTGADPMLSLYGALSLVSFAPEKAKAERLRVLSMAPHDQRLHRTAPDTLDLQILGSPRRSNLFERLFRGPDFPLSPGDRVHVEELEALVLQVQSGVPTHVRFKFARALGPDSCFLVWQGGRLSVIEPPELGKSVLISHTPGPMGI